MDTFEKALIMLCHLYANDECLKRADLGHRYLSFFNDKIDTAAVDDCVSFLQKSKLAVLDCDCLIPTDAGRTAGDRAQISYYFAEGIKASEKSHADRKYKEQGNGLVRCDSMIDAEQVDFIIDELASYKGSIYDLGCGTGELTAYIQKNIQANISGIDRSVEMISIARSAHPHINWIIGEIETFDSKSEIDAFLLVDSIYFVKERESAICRLYEKIRYGGKIVITYSAYTSKEHDLDKLEPQNSIVGKFIKSRSIATVSKEFTKNEIALWSSRLKLLEDLKPLYTEENNEYLYYDKKNEGDKLLTLLMKGHGRRYIYGISKSKI